LPPHEHRQRADVIKVRVGKNDRIERLRGERAEIRQRLFALLLRVHPAVEHEALAGGFEVITVGADLSPAREIDELQQREDERFGLTRAMGKLRGRNDEFRMSNDERMTKLEVRTKR
jgi:hypothetical protein